MKLNIPKERPRTDLFLRGITVETKKKLEKMKEQGNFRTFSALIDALLRDDQDKKN